MFNYMTVARFTNINNRPSHSTTLHTSYTSAMTRIDALRSHHNHTQNPGTLSLYLIQFDTQRPNNPGLVIRKEVN